MLAGLLRGSKTGLVKCIGNDLQVPSSAEFVLEGHIYPDEMADEGPFGDHTGYYNEVERFPVFTVERITHRRDPIYHSTYTGRPPDEPAVLNDHGRNFRADFAKAVPGNRGLLSPPEAARTAGSRTVKQYPGHASA